jgi:hypothetical protein
MVSLTSFEFALIGRRHLQYANGLVVYPCSVGELFLCGTMEVDLER